MNKLSVMVIIFLLMGCATTSTVVTGNKRVPVQPETVKIYSQFPEKYEEIAIITAKSEDGWTEDHKVRLAIKAMKKKAASLGANGVVITGADSSLGSASVRNIGSYYSLSFDSAQKVMGRAIYVPE